MAWTAYLSKVLRSMNWHTSRLVMLGPNSCRGLRREIASLLYMQYWLLQLTVALGSKLNLRQVTGI